MITYQTTSAGKRIGCSAQNISTFVAPKPQVAGAVNLTVPWPAQRPMYCFAPISVTSDDCPEPREAVGYTSPSGIPVLPPNPDLARTNAECLRLGGEPTYVRDNVRISKGSLGERSGGNAMISPAFTPPDTVALPKKSSDQCDARTRALCTTIHPEIRCPEH
jgi:hypothetical protein